jgi:hypothetical protein
MSATPSLAFTHEDRLLQETPLEMGTWGLATETLVPARHVVWASLALIAVTLAVLAFA